MSTGAGASPAAPAPGAAPPAARVAWIDAARGLGIVAIVIGHLYLPWDAHPTVFTFLYAFHVPAFFFLAGLTFSTRGRTVGQFVRRRVRSVAVPYLVWALVSVLVFQVLGTAAAAVLGRRPPGNLTQSVLGVVWANPSGHWMDWNKPLWFLPALLVTYASGLLVDRIGVDRLRISPWWWAALSLAPSWWFAQHTAIALPWSAERVLVLAPFFLAGMACRTGLRSTPVRRPVPEAAIGTLLLAATAVLSASRPSVDYVTKSYGSYGVFVVGAAAGTAGLVLLARALPARALVRCGRDSLAVLCLHKFVVVLVQLGLGWLGVDALPGAASSVIAVVLGTVVTAACVVVAVPVSRVAPWSLGRSRAQASGKA